MESATVRVDGGASEGAERNSQRCSVDASVEFAAATGLIVTMHFGEAATAACLNVTGIVACRFIQQAIRHIAMLRQQDIWQTRMVMFDGLGANIKACAHGLEEAVVPAQRTLTSASAAIGTTA
jgi:hypothetical protein